MHGACVRVSPGEESESFGPSELTEGPERLRTPTHGQGTQQRGYGGVGGRAWRGVTMPPSSASWSSVSNSSTLGLRAPPTSPRQEPSSGSSSSTAEERPGRGQAADTSRMAAALRGDRERQTDTKCAQAGRVRFALPRRDHVSRGQGVGHVVT